MTMLGGTPAGCEPIPGSNGDVLLVPKYALSFGAWKGEPCGSSYGGKAFIDLDGECLFAELAIVRLLARAEWAGVWVDTYRHAFRNTMPSTKPEPYLLPKAQSALFDRIVSAYGRPWSGCWDVFGWRGADSLFIESKRRRRDSMRSNQYSWFRAALSVGVPVDAFIVAEWELA